MSNTEKVNLPVNLNSDLGQPKEPTNHVLLSPGIPGGGASITRTGVTSSDAVFFIDTNVPGLPYRSPTAHPTNLKLAQMRSYLEMISVDV